MTGPYRESLAGPERCGPLGYVWLKTGIGVTQLQHGEPEYLFLLLNRLDEERDIPEPPPALPVGGFVRLKDPDDIILDANEITAKRTVRIVSANTVLCSAMLERIPIMRAEDVVNVLVRAGNAIVSVQGVAKQEGCVGDVITVLRTGSHDRLRATIVDSKNVIIDIEGTARISQAHQAGGG